jgi:hypothetical protein
VATLSADEHKKHATIKRDGGKFPIPDKAHARAALARLHQSDLSPAEKKKVKAAARAKLAEGGIDQGDLGYFDDARLDWLQDVAALQEAGHFDPLQPRGRTGQWIKKLQAASTPAARRELVSQHIHTGGDPGNNAEAAMVFHEIADTEGDDFVKATLKSIGHRIETEEHAKPLFDKAKATVAKGDMLTGKQHFDAATAEQARIDKRWGKDPNEPHGFRVKGAAGPATGEPHLVHQLEPGTTFLHPTTGKLLRVKSHAMIPRPGQHLPKRTTRATHVSDGSPATLDGHTLVTPSKYRKDPDDAEISGYLSDLQYGSGTRPNLAGWSPEALKRYHESLHGDDENYEDPAASAGFNAEIKRVRAALKKLQEGAMTEVDWDARAREVLAEAGLNESATGLAEVSSASLPDLPNKPGKTNWVEKAGGLPHYIERIAKHLHSEKGMDVSRAIAVAVNVVKRMCASGDTNFPGKQSVNAGSRAQACAAVADWERKKVSHAATDDRYVTGALRLLEAHAVPPVFSATTAGIAAEIMADDEAEEQGLTEAARREYVRNRRGQFATLFKAAAENRTVPRQARPDPRKLPKK